MISKSSQGGERTVEFLSEGLTLRGIFRVPNGDGPHPLVLLGHGFGALKEWTLPDIGAALVEAGIAAMWFDFRNTGDSEGQPRDEVSHYGRLQDWMNAIAYGMSLAEVDPDRVGIWGTSLGGRDVLIVGGIERRLKAVISQTPLIKWSAAAAARMAGYGEDMARHQQDLLNDRKNRALGEKPAYLKFVKPVGDDVKQAYVDSLTKDELRNYSGNLTLQSYAATALTDVTLLVELISPTPLLFILAEEDFLPGQRDAYAAAKEPKSLVTIAGNHFSPYTSSLASSIAATTEFFVKHLTPAQ